MKKEQARLAIIVPCYNESQVLPKTSKLFLKQLTKLIRKQVISEDSKIIFIDDGSADDTWKIIQQLSKDDDHFAGIRQSRNRGHQNAVLAGLMEAKNAFDVTISIDCDGQDDIIAMEEMIDYYRSGAEVVYGVRSNRDSDTFLKRFTAESFYRIMQRMGVETVFNHADYRLISSKVLEEFANFKEVNLFLRGLVPLVGFKSEKVYYERNKRIAGESHYPFKKMLGLALDGITSLSVKPIRFILYIGVCIAVLSFLGIVYSVIIFLLGKSVSGWASLLSVVCFFGGVQMCSLGIIGEYIGKIYLETKARPRYIISERTDNLLSNEQKTR